LAALDEHPDSPGWRKLVGSVSALAGAPAPAAETRQPGAEGVSVCVLPFQNMSGDSEQEYFSDGISEDITTDLSKVSALEVIARNTAFTYKGRSVNVCEVASKLGVTHVLEGSVRKVGNQVRITAQLIDGASGGHVWADRYDRDLTDIFAIQDEITKEIVRALRLKLLPEEKKAIEQRGTLNAEAYNLYLLARQYWMTGNHGDVRREERVMRICSRAVELDPQYADAWALLSIAQSSLKYNFDQPVDDGFAAANAALSIDPTIPQARVAHARRHQQRGNQEKAAAEMEEAIRLGPDSWEVNRAAGRYFLDRRDPDSAVRHYERAVRLVDDDFHSWAMVAMCHKALGNDAKVAEAAKKMVSEAQRAVGQDPSNGAALGILAGGYAILGERDRAREWIERALLIDPDNVNMKYNFACVLAGYVGDKVQALELLRRALSGNSVFHARVAETDSDLQSLHDDPEFRQIIADAKQRLGIDQTATA
jgi:adenylate cyclase